MLDWIWIPSSSRRSVAAASLACGLVLALGSPAGAQMSLLGETLTGMHSVRINASGGERRIQLRQQDSDTAVFAVDGGGVVTYTSVFLVADQRPRDDPTDPPRPPIDVGTEFSGTVDESGRVPELSITDLPGLAASIAAAIVQTDFEVLDPVMLTIDPASVRVRFRVRERPDFRIRINVQVDFTGTTGEGEIRGRARLKSDVSTNLAGSCAICGQTFAGEERYREVLVRCGRGSARGGASLAIAADADDDGTATFTYTDSSAMALTGTITQFENKLECTLDRGAQVDALEADLETLAQAECGLTPTQVLLGDIACSGTTNRDATRVNLRFGARVATSGGGLQTDGRVGTSAKLTAP